MSDDQTKPALPTLAEIEAMEALLGRASPGPLSDGGDDYVFCSPSLGGVPIFEVRGTGARLPQAANRRWLVALWNWAPLLLAAAREVLRLREVVAVVNGDGGHGSPQDAIDRHYAICAERDALREELARVKADLGKAENAGITAAMFALREAPLDPSAAVGMVRLVLPADPFETPFKPAKPEPMVLRREQVVGLFEALEKAATPLLTGKFRTAYEAVRRYEEHDGLVAERDALREELKRVGDRSKEIIGVIRARIAEASPPLFIEGNDRTRGAAAALAVVEEILKQLE